VWGKDYHNYNYNHNNNHPFSYHHDTSYYTM